MTVARRTSRSADLTRSGKRPPGVQSRRPSAWATTVEVRPHVAQIAPTGRRATCSRRDLANEPMGLRRRGYKIAHRRAGWWNAADQIAVRATEWRLSHDMRSTERRPPQGGVFRRPETGRRRGPKEDLELEPKSLEPNWLRMSLFELCLATSTLEHDGVNTWVACTSCNTECLGLKGGLSQNGEGLYIMGTAYIGCVLAPQSGGGRPKARFGLPELGCGRESCNRCFSMWRSWILGVPNRSGPPALRGRFPEPSCLTLCGEQLRTCAMGAG